MTRIDLIPPELVAKKRGQKIILLMTAVFGGVLFILAVIYGVSFARIEAVKSEINFLRAQRSRVDAVAEKLRPFEARKSELAHREKLISKITSDEVLWASILNGISMVTPNDVWLKDFKADVTPLLKSEKQTAPTGGGTGQTGIRPITITGFTFSHSGVARWLVRLNEINDFSDIWLVYSEEKSLEGKKVVEFQTTANLRKFRSASKGAKTQ